LEESIKLLHVILSDFLQLLEKLQEVIQVEHEALIAYDLKSIERQSFHKQSFLEQMRRLDSQCMACMERFPARDFQQLMEILEKNPMASAKEMVTIGRLFKNKLELVMRAKELVMRANAKNQTLVMSSLEHIERMKKNLWGRSHTPTYNQAGKSASWAQPRLFVKEI